MTPAQRLRMRDTSRHLWAAHECAAYQLRNNPRLTAEQRVELWVEVDWYDAEFLATEAQAVTTCCRLLRLALAFALSFAALWVGSVL